MEVQREFSQITRIIEKLIYATKTSSYIKPNVTKLSVFVWKFIEFWVVGLREVVYKDAMEYEFKLT
jgi:hypothetical protein